MTDFSLLDSEKFTPMMQQYLKIKEEAKDLILLYRLGEFYEMFLDDAKEVSKLLNLTLTRRGYINGKPIPMAGIPVNSLDQYLIRLLDKGKSIAICEQVGEIKNNKLPIERKIVKIITPGTLIDDALLPAKSDRIILCIVKSKTNIGLSYLNLSNGEFYVNECQLKDLETEIYRLDPAEILISDDFQFHLSFPAKISKIDKSHFYFKNAKNQLLNHFKVESIICFGIENMQNGICAAGALMKYVIKTQSSDLSHIRKIKIDRHSDYVVLDPETRKNLEITNAIKGNEESTLLYILDHCKTSMGSRLLKKWLNNPIRSKDSLIERQKALTAFLIHTKEENCKYDNSKLLKLLSSFPDLERIVSRISIKSVKPRELCNLRDALSILPDISYQLRYLIKSSNIISNINDNLKINNDLASLLQKSIASDPFNNLKDGYIISKGFDNELDELRNIYQNSHENLEEIERTERNLTGINNLKIEFNRVNGFYIEVSKGQIYKVPKCYQRKQTLKNSERYITNELKELENRILLSKEKAIEREKLIYDNLLSEINKYSENIFNCAIAIANLDVILNLANHARSNNWVLPEITDNNEIFIKEGRHPVVEKNIEYFIPNSCNLNDDNRMLIITGPNMGGKSTYMRQIAIISLLAKIGSYVPAEYAKIGNIDRIFTRIGANDDISSGRSTFMVEMTETASILLASTANSLVLMDEIGRGTSTYDGLSLAWSIAVTLLNENRSLTLFSTHYFELTKIVLEFSNVSNVHLAVSESESDIIFLHKVQTGPSNKSYGIQVAKKAGVPMNVIKLANEKLKILESHNDKKEQFYDKNTEIIEKLTETNIDHIKPIEALQIIHDLQLKLSKE